MMLPRLPSQLIAIFALIFLFGLAQQGLVAHEISHLSDYTKQSQSNRSSNNQPSNSQQDKSTHSNLCEKCLCFSQINGAVASSYFVATTFANHFIQFTDVQYSVQSRFSQHYGARAPPQLA
ncbi:MAG: hypothetical protein H7Z18_08435 [Methylophilaceae bacterium]|nr:hypothetical protein [Methylophilaceae bacterium]